MTISLKEMEEFIKVYKKTFKDYPNQPLKWNREETKIIVDFKGRRIEIVESVKDMKMGGAK